jgi:hypothetical protein
MPNIASRSAVLCAVFMGLAAVTGARAADAPKAPQASKPMKMDEPMPGEMKKPGMKTGDVKKAAGKKDREMKAMMQKEEKSMPGGGAKK